MALTAFVPVELMPAAAYALRLRAILDEAPEAVRVVDPDTLRILDVNRADCDLSGHPREEMIGRDARDFWPEEPALRARVEANLDDLRTRGAVQTFGLPYRTRSGKILPVDSTSRVVEHQARCYHVVIFRDATARLALEAVRHEAAQLRSIRALANASAHEINNALAVITGSLELIKARQPPDTQEGRWLDRALDAGHRIQEIVARMGRITVVQRMPVDEGLPPALDIRRSSPSVSR